MHTPSPLRQLLARQESVVALWQMPVPLRRAAARAVRRGEWQRLTHRTFLAAPAPPSTSQFMWASVLHGGEGARLSGRNALVLHGWEESLAAPFDVVVAHHVQTCPGPDWLRLSRMVASPPGPTRDPARTSVHVSAVHASAWARSDREAMFVIVSALQQRLTVPARLADALEHFPRLPRRSLVREVAAEFEGGIHSLNERRFARLCDRFGVPQPVRQVRRVDDRGTVRAIDAEFRTPSGRILRLEIEGLQHLNPAHYFADITRDNALQIQDPSARLRVTSWVLRHEPEPFMRDLRRWVLGI